MSKTIKAKEQSTWYYNALWNVTWSPIAVGIKSYKTARRILDTKTILRYLAIPLSTNAVGSYLIYELFKQLNDKSPLFFESFTELSKVKPIEVCPAHELPFMTTEPMCLVSEQPWHDFKGHLTDYIILVAKLIAVFGIQGAVRDYFANKLSLKASEELDKKLHRDQTILACTSDKKSETYLHSTEYDRRTLISNSISIVLSATSSLGQAYFSIKGVSKLNTQAISAIITVGLCVSLINSFLLNQQRAIKSERFNIDTEFNAAKMHDIQHLRDIYLSGGDEYMRKSHLGYRTKVSHLVEKAVFWQSITNTWSMIASYTTWLSTYFIVGYGIQYGMVSMSDFGAIMTCLKTIQNLVDWSNQNFHQVEALHNPTKRLNGLFDIADAHTKRTKTLIFKEDTTGKTDITVSGYEMKLGERLLVSIPSLKFEKGKVYALIGPSGTGKSSFLTKLMGVYTDAVTAEGSVSFPKETSKVMIPQTDYFPIKCTLLEAIYYPKTLPSDPKELSALKTRVKGLLQEAQIDAIPGTSPDAGSSSLIDELDTRDNWSNRLSGGQKKKIKIISAILHNPSLLVMDESFNGLDHNSISIIQKMVKKYLPEATVLVVDHQYEANNKNIGGSKFYDHILDFANKKVTEKTIPSALAVAPQ